VYSDLEVITTLYKTPKNQLQNLCNYKPFTLRLFEQEGSLESKKKIRSIIKRNFQYYFSKKNIGLPKSTNFLLNKVKTKYVLFTQADISINPKEIIKLKKLFKKDKNIIFIAPTEINQKIKDNFKRNSFTYVKNINAACIVCDVKKIKELNFFDEDFFLYWEDVDLNKRVNNSNYKMVLANNIFVEHKSSQSSINDLMTIYIRTSNYVFGELVFDYKYKKLRFIKIFRIFLKNFFLFFYEIFKFNFKLSLIKLFKIFGIFKFIFYYFKKIFNIID
jgi:N-acetylglucosaminyl-diphospho-decaprenol L-rhamnosyltransferase